MSLTVSGTVSRVIEREAGNNGNTWIERTLVIEDWGQTDYVVASRELVAELELESNGGGVNGSVLALVVAVRNYVGKDGAGRHSLTGLRVHPQVTEALNAKGIRAAG